MSARNKKLAKEQRFAERRAVVGHELCFCRSDTDGHVRETQARVAQFRKDDEKHTVVIAQCPARRGDPMARLKEPTSNPPFAWPTRPDKRPGVLTVMPRGR